MCLRNIYIICCIQWTTLWFFFYFFFLVCGVKGCWQRYIRYMWHKCFEEKSRCHIWTKCTFRMFCENTRSIKESTGYMVSSFERKRTVSYSVFLLLFPFYGRTAAFFLFDVGCCVACRLYRHTHTFPVNRDIIFHPFMS